ncbi:extracellular solute-binding protein [Galbitalea soli]|uniref:Extracellular solute-binding protein n=1 Tax=Galbitalea soli TaxID=1268042 RepID=A0A7C9TQJ4_9MICO|nr:extracellular solute-binding protein [Galbitalea soli]NEM91059.1 extracellular solute-binding protein [Galbitalea soli]NYJ29747.1 multiple sugar transport system substrate-binding protein [Galbitalea soli]
MIRKKWPVLVAIVAGSTLLLSGCGQQKSAISDTPAAVLSSGKATGTVTVWGQGTEGEQLAVVAKDFEKENPGVTVNVTPVPWGSALSKYQTAVAGGTTPDIGQLGTDWMPSFATALTPTPSSIDTSGIFPEAVQTTDLGGTHYGVPWYVETRVIWYRKDLVAKAGFATFPTTFDGFVKLSEALKKGGAKYAINLPTSGFNAYINALPLLFSQGANVTSADDKSWTINSDAMVSAVTDVSSLFSKGLADRTPSVAAGATQAAFVDGSVPMFISGPWEIGGLKAAGGAGFEDKIGAAVIPGTKPTSLISGSDLVVFKTSKNSDAAWKFIDYLNRPAVQTAWFTATGDLPAQTSAWNDPAVADNPIAHAFGEQLKSVKQLPSASTWPQVSAAADATWEQIVKGSTSVSSGLAALQAKATSLGMGN